MKKIVLFACLLMVVGCSRPDPYDKVRVMRRNYSLELDVTVNEKSEASYEIKIQNLNGSGQLQDLTVDIKLLDGEQKVLWETRKILDVTGVGSYATKAFQFKNPVPEGTANWEYKNLYLAPDDESSDFKNYKEFMRVVRK